jgi:hypothetical protein
MMRTTAHRAGWVPAVVVALVGCGGIEGGVNGEASVGEAGVGVDDARFHTEDASGDARSHAEDAKRLVEEASFDAPPPPTGLAGFALVLNDVVQAPMRCEHYAWQYAPPPGQTSSPGHPPTPGIDSAYIVNTGTLPLAYVAQSLWGAAVKPGTELPGVLTGESYQLAGVLAPGKQVDITSVYTGGYAAMLGSAEPFSSGTSWGDEGTIPWPAGVPGTGGASIMHVAQVYVPISSLPPSCLGETKYW